MKKILCVFLLVPTLTIYSNLLEESEGSITPTVKEIRQVTEEILQVVKPYLPNNPIIIEAGACKGEDSFRIAKFWSEGTVYSFEPTPEHFNLLNEVTNSCPNLKCFQKALSDRNGSAVFYLSEFEGKIGASSSLLPPKRHLEFDPRISFDQVIEVETITLDDWAAQQGVNEVDFFWLDMQGYELHMLKASKLALTASAIYIEVEFVEDFEGQYLYEDIKSWMHENGFRMVAADFKESQIAEEVENHRRHLGNALFVKN